MSAAAAAAGVGGEELADELAHSSELPNFRYSYDRERFEEGGREGVNRFLRQLQSSLNEKNTGEVHNLYEHDFNKISEKHFESSNWPSPESLDSVVDEDPMFDMLYRELYYRHYYAKCSDRLTLAERRQSWTTYTELFEEILESDELEVDIPNQWLWDMIDEFVYQYQAFCQYKMRLKSMPSEELEMLMEDGDETWNTTAVIRYLENLRDRSGICALLAQEQEGIIDSKELWDEGAHHVKRMLGYFAVIGLLRVFVLLGDYNTALRCMDPIDLTRKGLYARLTVCQITTFYYLGFAYLMQRRYVDAIRSFTSVLVYLSRTKQFHTRSYQYENMIKKNEHLYGLLCMTLSLNPMRVEETVHSNMKEKYNEQMQKMIKGDIETFESVFMHCAPRFVSGAQPSFHEEPLENHHWEPRKEQFRHFAEDIPVMCQLQELRSFLKLYTSIPVAKIASFLKVSEEEFRSMVLRLKRKSRQLVWSSGPAVTGEWTSTGDLDFFVDKDMIYISDTKLSRRYVEYFVRQIGKFESLYENIVRKTVASSSSTAAAPGR